MVFAMKYVSALVFLTICSSFLSFTAQASNSKDLLNRGFEKLYLQELNQYLACREESAERCQFSEVEFYLELMGLKKVRKTAPVKYPKSAQLKGYAAVVDSLISINEDGSVESVDVLYCSSGKGDPRLQFNWSEGGQYCSNFEKASVKALSEWEFKPLPERLQSIPRKFQHRVVFSLPNQSSQDINIQITELKKSQVRKIQKLTAAKEWSELEAYALKNIDKNPVFRYYAADSAWMMGNKALAIERFTDFLENGGNSYWHFGIKAAAIVIPHYYESGNDKKVVELGRPSLLEPYLREGNVVSKSAVAQAIIFYATSLMFQDKPEMAYALTRFKSLKKYGRRYGGITSDQMRMINEQIANLEAQVIKIGQSDSES